MGERHLVPQAPDWRRSERGILDEIPTVVGLVLWQMLRHVRDWVVSAPHQREHLFHDTCPPWVATKYRHAEIEAPVIARPMQVLLRMKGAPNGVAAATVADACSQIAEWASACGWSETALQFAEAAAAADSESAHRANEAGRITRNHAEYARAETWFERGIALARQQRDSIAYTRGHIGFGILCQTLGLDNRAWRHFNTASIAARKRGSFWLAAEAQHDLLLMMAERGHFAQAITHARKALRWYPKHHPRFPFFVADFAFCLVCQAHYSEAVELLAGVLDALPEPAEQVLAVSVLVRAYGGLGEVGKFRSARQRLIDLLSTFKAHEPAARVNLAEGERAVGRWLPAWRNATRALRLAKEKRDAVVIKLATRLRADVRAQQPAPPNTELTDNIAREVIDALQQRLPLWNPTRRGRARGVDRDRWAAA
jgi:tetratricopeptide (TPR) repeat protein